MTSLYLAVCSIVTSLDTYPLITGLFLGNGKHLIKNKLKQEFKKEFPQHKMKQLHKLLECTAMLFKLPVCDCQIMHLWFISLRSLALDFTAWTNMRIYFCLYKLYSRRQQYTWTQQKHNRAWDFWCIKWHMWVSKFNSQYFIYTKRNMPNLVCL